MGKKIEGKRRGKAKGTKVDKHTAKTFGINQDDTVNIDGAKFKVCTLGSTYGEDGQLFKFVWARNPADFNDVRLLRYPPA